MEYIRLSWGRPQIPLTYHQNVSNYNRNLDLLICILNYLDIELGSSTNWVGLFHKFQYLSTRIFSIWSESWPPVNGYDDSMRFFTICTIVGFGILAPLNYTDTYLHDNPREKEEKDYGTLEKLTILNISYGSMRYVSLHLLSFTHKQLKLLPRVAHGGNMYVAFHLFCAFESGESFMPYCRTLQRGSSQDCSCGGWNTELLWYYSLWQRFTSWLLLMRYF